MECISSILPACARPGISGSCMIQVGPNPVPSGRKCTGRIPLSQRNCVNRSNCWAYISVIIRRYTIRLPHGPPNGASGGVNAYRSKLRLPCSSQEIVKHASPSIIAHVTSAGVVRLHNRIIDVSRVSRRVGVRACVLVSPRPVIHRFCHREVRSWRTPVPP